jgi:hypothetical protein
MPEVLHAEAAPAVVPEVLLCRLQVEGVAQEEERMSEWVKIACIVSVFVGMLLLSVWWEVYKYHDCRRVGHSTLYCIAAGGR